MPESEPSMLFYLRMLTMLLASCALFPILCGVDASTSSHTKQHSSESSHSMLDDNVAAISFQQQEQSKMFQDEDDATLLAEPMSLTYHKVRLGQPAFAPLK